MKINFSLPKLVLPFLKDKMDGFYLSGGTALSMFYYEHRESFDLDFFTRKFSKDRILTVVDNLQKNSTWLVELVSEQSKKGLMGISIYMIHIDKKRKCKIDFVEDFIEPMHPFKMVDGINILSLEDIYLRKIYTIAGHISAMNEVGQKIVIGGRQEAKDFYDIYCLSTVTMPLSEFVSRHCNDTVKEGVVRWYQTYDRMAIKTGLLDLVTKAKPDYRVIENHFKKEIDKLLEDIIGG